MNVERLHERLLYLIVLIGGIGFAIFCGMMAGQGQFNRLGLIFFLFGIAALCLILRERIWIIIPLLWPLQGSIPLMELPFGIRDMSVLIVFACFLILIGFKVVRGKSKFDLIDVLLGLNVLYLCSVFIRNPVGSKMFQSELIGGKPYFNVFIAGVAYYVLCRVPPDLKTVIRLPLYLLPAPALVALGSLLVTYAPGVAGSLGLGLIYSDFAMAEKLAVAEDAIGRKAGLTVFGVTGLQVLTSYFRPLTFLMPAYFGRMILALVFLTAVLLSGFRSALMNAGAFVVFSSYFRQRTRDLLTFVAVGVIGLTILIIGNGRFFELPLAAQRALSFLPGKWDDRVVADAKASIDWRVDMWSMVWHEDRWIQNKLLGDGFGFTRRELAIMENFEQGGVGFIGGAEQEAFMINGVFHHGPLSAIRYVGVVGLTLFFSFLLVLASRVLKLIKVTRGTDLFPSALFIGMPVLYYTLTFPFGGGQFNIDYPEYIFFAGFIKLLSKAAESIATNSAVETQLGDVNLPTPVSPSTV